MAGGGWNNLIELRGGGLKKLNKHRSKKLNIVHTIT